MPNKILSILRNKSFPITWEISTDSGFGYLEDLPTAVNSDRTVNWEVLARHYGTGDKGIYIGFEADGSPRKDQSPPWQEINFGSVNPQVEIGSQGSAYIISLVGKKLDSYTIQAMRRHKITPRDNFIDNSVQGILVKERKFLLGCRGGYDLSGTLQPIPGGSVLWKDHYNQNPIEDGFASEAEEEAGTPVLNPRLYGIFNQTGAHTNRQWLFVAEPEKSLEHIAADMVDGLELYLKEKQLTGGNDALARTALRESPYPLDSWENVSTAIFSYDADTFLRLLHDGKWISLQGQEMRLIGTLPADLYLAGVVDFGSEFEQEAKKLPLIKEAITF